MNTFHSNAPKPRSPGYLTPRHVPRGEENTSTIPNHSPTKGRGMSTQRALELIRLMPKPKYTGWRSDRQKAEDARAEAKAAEAKAEAEAKKAEAEAAPMRLMNQKKEEDEKERQQKKVLRIKTELKLTLTMTATTKFWRRKIKWTTRIVLTVKDASKSSLPLLLIRICATERKCALLLFPFPKRLSFKNRKR